jgi:hypothetical protein
VNPSLGTTIQAMWGWRCGASRSVPQASIWGSLGAKLALLIRDCTEVKVELSERPSVALTAGALGSENWLEERNVVFGGQVRKN